MMASHSHRPKRDREASCHSTPLNLLGKTLDEFTTMTGHLTTSVSYLIYRNTNPNIPDSCWLVNEAHPSGGAYHPSAV